MKTWIVGAGLALVLGAPQRALANEPAAPGAVKNDTAAAAHAPDNTGRNERDRSVTSVTPMDQSNDPKDVELTQQIRKVVVADDALSMNAHNVKIITDNGMVVLRGPVNSAAEKATVEAKAKSVAGVKQVTSQLEVVSAK